MYLNFVEINYYRHLDKIEKSLYKLKEGVLNQDKILKITMSLTLIQNKMKLISMS